MVRATTRKTRLPNEKTRASLLYRANIPQTVLNCVGETYLASRRYNDAFDFFARAQNTRRIKYLHDVAIDNGDPSILIKCEELQRKQLSSDEWATLADHAYKKGELLLAEYGYLRSLNEVVARKVRQERLTKKLSNY